LRYTVSFLKLSTEKIKFEKVKSLPLKPFIIILILTTVSLSSPAQKKLPKFGQIDIADLKMTSCGFEPDAPALKLFDATETDFTLFADGDSKMKIEQRVRIKIFNEKGYQHANVRIPYINKRGIGKIKELRGVIYSLDSAGKIIREELDKNDFFKQSVVENMGVVSFTFPNLKPGSVVEYSYTRIENKIYQIDPWIIQGDIPVQYSYYSVTVPFLALLKEKLFGIGSVNTINEKLTPGHNKTRSYFKEKIPSFKPEPFMTSEKDNLMKMIFFHIPRASFALQTVSLSKFIWPQVGDYFLKSDEINGQIKKDIPGAVPIIDSALKITSIQDRIRYIYNSVRKQIPQKTEQTIHPKSIIEAWNNHMGNSAEINLIMLNLLEKAKVTSYPALISTRENGIVSIDFPSFGQFNGLDVLAMIDSVKYLLIDANQKFQSVNNPPVNILNRDVLLLKPGKVDWLYIYDKRHLMKQVATLFCDINESGTIEGEASIHHYHYAKSFILDTTLKEEKDKNEKFFHKRTQGLIIHSSKQEITEEDDDPIYETVSFTYQPLQTENFYFLNPQFLTPQKENPFTTDKRNTDIDLICNQEIDLSININIPESFEVDHLPKNMIVRSPDSSFFYKRFYSVSAGKIFLSQVFQVNNVIFSRDQYAGIKEFFSKMFALMHEEIILKKKK